MTISEKNYFKNKFKWFWSLLNIHHFHSNSTAGRSIKTFRSFNTGTFSLWFPIQTLNSSLKICLFKFKECVASRFWVDFDRNFIIFMVTFVGFNLVCKLPTFLAWTNNCIEGKIHLQSVTKSQHIVFEALTSICT